MKWVRRNSLQKPVWPRKYNPQTRRYEMDPDAKPYRMYSKWHLLHEGKSDSDRVMSLCGQYSGRMAESEVSETQPASGRRSYRTQNPTCYYCRLVAKATE